MTETGYTRADILRIAAEQSAVDSSCRASDFFGAEHVVVLSRSDGAARKDLTQPFAFDLTSYGRNVVASVRRELVPVAQEYLRGRQTHACFETPALHELDGITFLH